MPPRFRRSRMRDDGYRTQRILHLILLAIEVAFDGTVPSILRDPHLRNRSVPRSEIGHYEEEDVRSHEGSFLRRVEMVERLSGSRQTPGLRLPCKGASLWTTGLWTTGASPKRVMRAEGHCRRDGPRGLQVSHEGPALTAAARPPRAFGNAENGWRVRWLGRCPARGRSTPLASVGRLATASVEGVAVWRK